MAAPSHKSLTIALASLLAARALLSLLPGTWGWSLQLQRFAFPPLAWTLWGLAALSLVPAVAKAQAPWLARIARAVESAPRRSVVAAALAAAALVFALPDRVWFTGDFLLRVGVLESRVDLGRIAPQSLPLDLWLHIEWPRWLARAGWLAEPAEAARWLGAVEAGAFAALALVVAGAEGHRGAARLAFAAVVAGGAGVALMTGYGKTAGEMCLLTLAIAWLGRRLALRGSGAAALGLAMGVALLSHRSALVLLPVWVAAWIVAGTSGRIPRGAWARVLGLGVPIAALIVVGPRVAELLVGFDLPRHLLGGSGGAGNFPGALLHPVVLLDRLNVALAYAPLAPLLLLPVIAGGSRDVVPHAARISPPPSPAEERRLRAVDLAAFVPALAMGLLVVPQQGLFRDWDVFAVPGTLLALATARRAAAWAGSGVAEPARAEAGAGAARRALPLLWSALLGAGLWLAAGYDERGGLARVRAFATESPARDPVHTAKLWEFLGDRAAALGHWDDAAGALREAVIHQPSPRLFMMLSMAESELGNLGAAEDALARAAERDPNVASSWAAWVLLSLRRGNEEGARTAALGLRRIAPDHPLVRQVLGDSAAADTVGRSRPPAAQR
jgi:tetratricopeptide (TPR) repeat protein